MLIFDNRAVGNRLLALRKRKGLTQTELAFRCHCSKQRVSEILLSLGEKDLKSLVEDGHAEACCLFCGERYQFTGEELQAIYDHAMADRRDAQG